MKAAFCMRVGGGLETKVGFGVAPGIDNKAFKN